MNEAAERLRKTLAADGWKDTDLDLALAAERRAQAKRDRAAVYGCNTIEEARRWLDEEATR